MYLGLAWGPRSPGKDLETLTILGFRVRLMYVKLPLPLQGGKNRTLDVNRTLLTPIPDARESRMVCSHQ